MRAKPLPVCPPKNPYRNDPDETKGRRLYRGLANAQAAMDLGMARRVTMKKESDG